MTDNDYLIAYEREKAARLAAEKLLETLTREVYFKNAELEKINREFKEQQQALIQQEKMASVGFLASGIAHEINNPLGYSLSNMSVLS
jgi:two-component system NtrC family sensor kinase